MAKESTSRTNDYQDFIQPHEDWPMNEAAQKDGHVSSFSGVPSDEFPRWYEQMSADELETSDYGRECSGIVKVGVWAAILGISGAIWGFVIAWIYPVIHRLLQ